MRGGLIGAFVGGLAAACAAPDPVAGPPDASLVEDGGVELAGCEPSPCHVATRDPATGRCVESNAPDGTACESLCMDHGTCNAGACVGQRRDCSDGDPCTADTCDPLRGCASAPLAEGESCGLADCAAAPVCRGGACVTERIAPADRDDRVCGLDTRTQERPPDPRAANATLFVRGDGAVDVIASGFFAHRAPGGWSDVSARVAGRVFADVVVAGPDTYFGAEGDRVLRFGPALDAREECTAFDFIRWLQPDSANTLWIGAPPVVEHCANGATRYVASDFSAVSQVAPCPDGSVWTSDFEGTSSARHGRVLGRVDGASAGLCLAEGLFVIHRARLARYAGGRWTWFGAELDWQPAPSRPEDARLVGTGFDDLWLLAPAWGRAHWNGHRWTRLADDVTAWVTPRANEAWVVGRDGAIERRTGP